MSEMIERVAAVLDSEVWEMDGPTPTRADTISFHERRQISAHQARLAIEAMRNPTEAMFEETDHICERTGDELEIYHAFIDAALK